MEKEKFNKRPVEEKQTIPVLEEEVVVGKRLVETGVTRVDIKVHRVEQVVREQLQKERVEVERVTINRIVDRPVATRTEGDVTIIPVMEEVLVVEKKLRLKEEIHIRQLRETVTHSQKEVVRKEEAVVGHTDLRKPYS